MLLRYEPLARIPEDLRQSILRAIEIDYITFENLREQRAEAMRNRCWDRAQEVSKRMGEYIAPSNPAVKIVGGQGGYVLVDESRFGLRPETAQSLNL
jgi:hypothetical protein